MKKINLPLILSTLLAAAFLSNVGVDNYVSSRWSNVFTSTSYAQEDSLDFSALDETTRADVEETPRPDGASVSVPADVDQTPDSQKSTSSQRAKFVDLVLAGGWIGVILLISSILAVSLIIRLCLTLRRSIIAPSDLSNAVSADVASGSYRSAFDKASQSDSFLGRVLTSGLREVDRGWNAVEKALEDALASETAAFYRRTDPLSVIGNVAPMLGLLGTVVGMVSTFGELAVADASGRNLANGIYFALVTTVDGLIVAIPVLVAHSLLNARIAGLVSFAAEQIDRALEPAKRNLASQVVRAATAQKITNVSTVVAPSTPKSAPESPKASEGSVENQQAKKPSGLREVAQRPALSLKNRATPERGADSDKA